MRQSETQFELHRQRRLHGAKFECVPCGGTLTIRKSLLLHAVGPVDPAAQDDEVGLETLYDFFVRNEF